MSLVEMVIAMVLLGIVLVIFLGALASLQTAAKRQGDRAENNDQARLAVEELDREIRSGNILYDPAAETLDPGYMLRIYTQSNAPTRPGFTCRLWKVTPNGELQTRSWPPQTPLQASAWRTVADGVVNRSLSPPVTPFVLSTDPNKGYRTMDIVLFVDANPGGALDDTVKIQTSITGRNTAYGYPLNECDVLP